jgi:hypothetical protein
MVSPETQVLFRHLSKMRVHGLSIAETGKGWAPGGNLIW